MSCYTIENLYLVTEINDPEIKKDTYEALG